MSRKKLLPLLSAAVLIVAAVVVLLATRGGKTETESPSDILSANIALLDGEQVPDYDLNTNDSLLRFERPVADLGRMKIGDKKNVVFRFTNASPAPVVITRIVTTCGCTSAEYEKAPVMPGRESEIQVGFEAEEEGVFFKKLFIYYAGGTSPLEIAIRGEVKR